MAFKLALPTVHAMQILNDLHYSHLWKCICLYCRFHITFQSAVPKFVVNLPITFPNSEVGRELRNKVRKFISKFEL
jgi:hypothetical protein